MTICGYDGQCQIKRGFFQLFLEWKGCKGDLWDEAQKQFWGENLSSKGETKFGENSLKTAS